MLLRTWRAMQNTRDTGVSSSVMFQGAQRQDGEEMRPGYRGGKCEKQCGYYVLYCRYVDRSFLIEKYSIKWYDTVLYILEAMVI